MGHPAIPYVAPFGVFLLFLAIRIHLPFGTHVEYPIRTVAVLATLFWVSRKVLPRGHGKPFSSILLGIGVFVLWIAPDLLFPGYRSHWLLNNQLVGEAASTIPQHTRSEFAFLFFRIIGSVMLVPVIEELFWRGWLMRYLISNDFRKVALGSYTPLAFWATAILFASEHGAYWDVGLAAGIAYNVWMVRTRNLADCILAHAVTNACLAIYVILFQRWEYWL